jgi:hypothetical protein
VERAGRTHALYSRVGPVLHRQVRHHGPTKSLNGEGHRDGIVVVVNCVMPIAWTRLTSQLPAGPIATLFRADFPAEGVSSFAVWLCHETCPIQGEVFSVGGGRAARVFLAKNKGARVDEHVPEAWVGTEVELLDTAEFFIPRDLADAQTLHFGNEGPAEEREGTP